MTKIIIDNVKDEYVSAFKGLVEEANATFSANPLMMNAPFARNMITILAIGF